MTTQKIYYHFTGPTLRDGRPIPPIGEWLIFEGVPIPCACGLHASPDAFEALRFAPGPLLHRVKLDGTIVAHGDPVDKFAAQKRKIVATVDATQIMREFARRVALDVIHLWDAPPVVREYLKNGDESKKAAGLAAARAAVQASAWGAARDAAGASAWAAARDAAWAAAGAAAWAAARGAAGAAARAAAVAAQAAAQAAAGNEKLNLYRGWFNKMTKAQFTLSAKAAKP